MTDNELPGNELPNNELRCKELKETSGDNNKQNECSASADNVPKVLLAQQKSKFLVLNIYIIGTLDIFYTTCELIEFI